MQPYKQIFVCGSKTRRSQAKLDVDIKMKFTTHKKSADTMSRKVTPSSWRTNHNFTVNCHSCFWGNNSQWGGWIKSPGNFCLRDIRGNRISSVILPINAYQHEMILQWSYGRSPFAVIDTRRVTQIYHKIVTKGRLTDRKLVAVVFARE